MSDALHLLLQVQEQDTQTDQVRHRRAHHPLRAAIRELSDRLTDLEARRRALQAVLDEVKGRQAAAETEAAAGNARISVLESRLYSGEVSAARDLQAMQAEVEALRARVSQADDAALEAMEEAEPLEASMQAMDAEVEAVAAESAVREQELSGEDAVLGAEEADHTQRRQELAASLPADLLARYEKLRQRLGGVAAAPLVSGSCGGCHLSLSATELDRVRKAPPEAVVTCEQCGRILVRP